MEIFNKYLTGLVVSPIQKSSVFISTWKRTNSSSLKPENSIKNENIRRQESQLEAEISSQYARRLGLKLYLIMVTVAIVLIYIIYLVWIKNSSISISDQSIDWLIRRYIEMRPYLRYLRYLAVGMLGISLYSGILDIINHKPESEKPNSITVTEDFTVDYPKRGQILHIVYPVLPKHRPELVIGKLGILWILSLIIVRYLEIMIEYTYSHPLIVFILVSGVIIYMQSYNDDYYNRRAANKIIFGPKNHSLINNFESSYYYPVIRTLALLCNMLLIMLWNPNDEGGNSILINGLLFMIILWLVYIIISIISTRYLVPAHTEVIKAFVKNGKMGKW